LGKGTQDTFSYVRETDQRLLILPDKRTGNIRSILSIIH
jgi:hypothetical protein